jgi:hypothetical protein
MLLKYLTRLTNKNMSYYKMVDGKKMDGRLLEMAEEAIQGAGDGRISQEDAEELMQVVRDGGSYTDVEKDTMEYIRDSFKWTESADAWFRSEIAHWAVEK